MLKKILLALSLLSIQACDSVIKPPAVWQCGHSIKFDKFRCINTESGEAVNLSRDDMRMDGAQCLSIEDYKKSEQYVSDLIEQAKQRCK
jgi:hypothetical protein